jgi:hypothetical protein
VPSERCSIEQQSNNIVGGHFAWCVAISDRYEIAMYHVTRHKTLIHNILSTAPQFSISQKSLETFPEDGNVMPKHVGDTIHN